MMLELLKCKIHRAIVTGTDLRYHGSLTVDASLMEAAGILEYEKVQVVNLNNGQRVETYCIPGRKGSGVICLNGAAARSAQPGDPVIILTYAQMEDEVARSWKPRIVFVDAKNRVARKGRSVAAQNS